MRPRIETFWSLIGLTEKTSARHNALSLKCARQHQLGKRHKLSLALNRKPELSNLRCAGAETSSSAALTVIKTKGTAARWGESGAGEPWVTSPSSLFFCSFLFFSFPCRGWASPPVRGFYSQRLGPFNAWDTQKQKNKEKVREPKRGRDGGSESSLFGWSSDQIRLFSDQACSSMRLESYPPHHHHRPPPPPP